MFSQVVFMSDANDLMARNGHILLIRQGLPESHLGTLVRKVSPPWSQIIQNEPHQQYHLLYIAGLSDIY